LILVRSARGSIFCDDDDLGYLGSRTQFTAGRAFELDETYRLAHLPLIAPAHPRVIARRPGAFYEMGRHEPVYSLVLPISADALHDSPAYRALQAELGASPLAGKIAWNIIERRGPKLHATICGSLGIGNTPPRFDVARREGLARLGPVSVELRGLFSGNANLGRLYFRAYPEKRDGLNMFSRIQQILGCRETSLYVVGIYNLIDDLDAVEAAALSQLIDRWWGEPILRFQADALWLLGANDDLVLESTVVETFPLT
jgi:hypothetical protein